MIIYILLFISLFFNILLLFKKKQKIIETIQSITYSTESPQSYESFFNTFKEIIKDNIFIFDKDKVIFTKNFLHINNNLKINILNFSSFLHWLNKNFFTRKIDLRNIIDELKIHFEKKNNYQFFLEDLNYNCYNITLTFFHNFSYIKIRNITENQNLVKANNLYKEAIKSMVQIINNPIVIIENNKYLSSNLPEEIIPVPENISLFFKKGNLEIYISMDESGIKYLIKKNIFIINKLLKNLWKNFNKEFFQFHLELLKHYQNVLDFQSLKKKENFNLFLLFEEILDQFKNIINLNKIKLINSSNNNIFYEKYKTTLIIENIIFCCFFSNSVTIKIFDNYFVIDGIIADKENFKILTHKFLIKIIEDNNLTTIELC